MADAHAGWHHAKTLEGLLRPVEQRIAFAVALVFPFEVDGVGIVVAETIDLHRVVDHEVDRDERVDALRVAASASHRAAHCGQVDHGRHTGEVLHQHPRRHERERRSATIRPARQRFDVGLRHVTTAGAARDVLEQDLDRVRQACDVGAGLRGQPVKAHVASTSRRRFQCCDAVERIHGGIRCRRSDTGHSALMKRPCLFLFAHAALRVRRARRVLPAPATAGATRRHRCVPRRGRKRPG